MAKKSRKVFGHEKKQWCYYSRLYMQYSSPKRLLSTRARFFSFPFTSKLVLYDNGYVPNKGGVRTMRKVKIDFEVFWRLHLISLNLHLERSPSQSNPLRHILLTLRTMQGSEMQQCCLSGVCGGVQQSIQRFLTLRSLFLALLHLRLTIAFLSF